MKYLRSIFSGPLSALSIVVLACPFWWVPFAGLSVFLVPAWTLVWLVFEVVWIVRGQSSTPRLLTHLRWGPLVTLLIFMGVTLAYDTIRIHQSKRAISNYVYYGSDNGSELQKLELHSDYRGWCGNGLFSSYYEHYVDSAREGFQSESPSVRMRALKASHYLAFQYSDERYTELIQAALSDSDPAIRTLACSYTSPYPVY